MNSTIWISKDFKDDLAMQKILCKKPTFEDLLKDMLKVYLEKKEEKQ